MPANGTCVTAAALRTAAARSFWRGIRRRTAAARSSGDQHVSRGPRAQILAGARSGRPGSGPCRSKTAEFEHEMSLSLFRSTPTGPEMNGRAVQPPRKSIRDLLGQRGMQYQFAPTCGERRHRGLHAVGRMIDQMRRTMAKCAPGLVKIALTTGRCSARESPKLPRELAGVAPELTSIARMPGTTSTGAKRRNRRAPTRTLTPSILCNVGLSPKSDQAAACSTHAHAGLLVGVRRELANAAQCHVGKLNTEVQY